jgi:hypothetical protein
VGKNILIPEHCLLIHVGRTRKGRSMPYMKVTKRKNISASIVGGNIMISGLYASIHVKKALVDIIHPQCET